MSNKVFQGTLTFFIFAALVCCDLSNVQCVDFVQSFPGFECAKDSLLGKGAFGVAFLVHNATTDAVLKVTEYQSGTSDQEVAILKGIDHPNVLKYFASATKGSYHLLLTEYGSNNDLQTYVSTHPNAFPTYKDKLGLILKIVQGLQHIHNAGIVHGDLKPANIVLDQNLSPKIIDFNLATHFNVKDVFKGTYEFASPKLMKYPEDPDHKFIYGPADDVYSLGVVIYWLFHDGHVPFEAKERKHFTVLHRIGLYTIKAGTPIGIGQAIQICLRRSQTERASLDQLATYISQLIDETKEIFFKKDLSLDTNKPFPWTIWMSNRRFMGVWAEFSEMFFIFSLAFALIPLTVYCLKRKFDGHPGAVAQANQPLHPPNNPEELPADHIAVVV
jgi:serine/threonine protein kinase